MRIAEIELRDLMHECRFGDMAARMDRDAAFRRTVAAAFEDIATERNRLAEDNDELEGRIERLEDVCNAHSERETLLGRDNENLRTQLKELRRLRELEGAANGA